MTIAAWLIQKKPSFWTALLLDNKAPAEAEAHLLPHMVDKLVII